MTAGMLDRRSLLRLGTLGLVGGMEAWLRAQAPGGHILPTYVADVDGDGQLGGRDIEVMRRAPFTSRGFKVEPNTGYDYRADIFGRAQVDQDAVDAVLRTIELFGNGLTVDIPRPITVAWHYGWYDTVQRPLLLQTVRYLKGDYLSNDPRVEEEFNQLKNEFGVTVDALSWMPPRVRPSLLQNYDAGYFAAANAATRYVALLYENALALPARHGRNDFRQPETTSLLVADFEAMARTLVAARDQHATRVFHLRGRPVIFVFGSHSWGLNADNELEFDRISYVVGVARDAFRGVYGEHPYLVGEELLQLGSSVEPSRDRVNRASNFDALFSYHAANLKPSATPFTMNEAYGVFQQRRLERAVRAARQIRSRFTGQRVLIIPSLAGGLAKHGMPTLTATRHAYASYLKRLARYYSETYLPQEFPRTVGTVTMPAPIFTVGSWNEEFEGHAVLPAAFNVAFGASQQGGFDYMMAIKETFGWNHYAERSILGS